MKRILGIATACATLAIAGCGGVSELESNEVTTVSEAKSAVKAAVAEGSLTPAGKKALEELMVLCHEKPLTETDGDSIREVINAIVPQLQEPARRSTSDSRSSPTTAASDLHLNTLVRHVSGLPR